MAQQTAREFAERLWNGVLAEGGDISETTRFLIAAIKQRDAETRRLAMEEAAKIAESMIGRVRAPITREVAVAIRTTSQAAGKMEDRADG